MQKNKNGNFRLESASGNTHGGGNAAAGDLEPSGPGRVLEIRKQWVVHEDEALAYRLQNEEINSYYSGNRVRNGVLREDIPFSKEMQEKEEKEALEQRMKYLNVLQMQADEDSKIANDLKLKYDRLRSSELEVDFDCLTEHGAEPQPEKQRQQQPPEFNRSSSSNSLNSFGFGATATSTGCSNNTSTTVSTSNHTNPGKNTPNIPSKLKPILNTKNCPSTMSNSSINANVNVAMAQVQTSSPKPGCSYSSNSNSNYSRNHELGVEFQSFEPSATIPPPKEFCTLGKINKQFEQLEKDAEIARMLQEELEKEELERLKIEAKDRELAQILHNKEKAKIQRAKERSRLKAANSSSQESANDSQSESQSPEGLLNPNSPTGKTPSIRNSSRSSSIASGGETPTPPTCSIEDTTAGTTYTTITPPKIPEKSQKKNEVGFKANPKPLPPQPQSQQSASTTSTTTYNYNLHQSPKNDNYPVPPYMPLQGILASKKKK